MKKLLLLLLVLLAPLAVAAQEKDGPAPAEGDKSKQKLKTIVDYKTELGLSDEQVNGISTTLKDFQTRVVELKKQLKESEEGFAKMLAEQAPLAQVKQQLRSSADLRFQLRYLDVVTARRVEGILSQEQLKKWRDIQAKVRGQ